ncbi:hypothetical protein PoB_004129100 [Plakobranchus ocellatus]|uniref:Integrase zinc-binding domain-containing protein n=1 Tax=Plakobranchus ocellatus TaxID=259542 RepID=A0AAV4AUN0_9GAST|nr:hypothetical protein PoB_004129100 [Plakobranchus ocellatus]
MPPSLREQVLQSLPAAHQSVSQMCLQGESSFFWPGMTSAIINLCTRCCPCNIMAPSQPSAPPTPPIQPTYPSQCICPDFLTYAGHNRVVIVDRYSNGPIVERAARGSQGLISSLRRTFVTYGISDELSLVGGPEFMSTASTTFLKIREVNHRDSSVTFPHSNWRAEIGVKTIKRLIAENTGTSGNLNTASFQKSLPSVHQYT